MTIQHDDLRDGPYIGTGFQTDFPVSFKLFTKADFRAVLADVNGIETTLVLDSTDPNVGYSVVLNVDQDNNPGGTVTYPIVGTPLATNQKLVFVGDLDYTQPADIINGGAWFPQVVEDAMDRNTLLIKQVAEMVARAITLPVSDTGSGEISGENVRRETFLYFDADGNLTTRAAGTPTPYAISSTEQIATAGQTVFSVPGGYVVGLVFVFLNGAQLGSDDFTAADGSSVTLAAGAALDDIVKILAFGTFSVPSIEANIASQTEALKGAGQVGFGSALAYAAGTVGARLRGEIDITDAPFNAAASKSNAENLSALQAAITEAGARPNGGVVVVPPDICYGRKTTDPATWPSFTGITKPVVVKDYGKGISYTGYPTAYDGRQRILWFHTPNTTSPYQHDGDTEWLRSRGRPAYIISTDGNIEAVGHPSRAATDCRLANYAVANDGEVTWQVGQSAGIGASLTSEEMSDWVEQKFFVTGDTLGAYSSRRVQRKTGNQSFGQGRGIPEAHYEFERVTGSPVMAMMMWRSETTQVINVLRCVVAGVPVDWEYRNTNGVYTLHSTGVGDAYSIDHSTRKFSFQKSFAEVISTVTYSASMTPNLNDGNIFVITATNGSAFTINAPANSVTGQRYIVTVRNASGGALGAATWAAGYKQAGWANPANGFSRSVSFYYDGASHIQCGQTGVDVPN